MLVKVDFFAMQCFLNCLCSIIASILLPLWSNQNDKPKKKWTRSEHTLALFSSTSHTLQPHQNQSKPVDSRQLSGTDEYKFKQMERNKRLIRFFTFFRNNLQLRVDPFLLPFPYEV